MGKETVKLMGKNIKQTTELGLLPHFPIRIQISSYLTIRK